ncbi:MAG: HAD family phosphatase [Nanoarchaeota archaeon]|nr:HAD family phosphatase [Nanoarchaeota archaeon]
MVVKAVIFDVGGVYLQGSFIDFVNRSYAVLGIEGTFHADKEVVFDSDYNRGRITAEECFRKYFGVPISVEQMKLIMDLWTTTWKLTDEMRALVERLKPNYRLAILSNSDLINSRGYRERGWYSPFEVSVLSHEEGILKPERRIYEITLERLALPAKECVIIDDQEAALVPARELGMRTIQYRSTGQLERELIELEMEVD